MRHHPPLDAPVRVVEEGQSAIGEGSSSRLVTCPLVLKIIVLWGLVTQDEWPRAVQALPCSARVLFRLLSFSEPKLLNLGSFVAMTTIMRRMVFGFIFSL